MPNVMALPPLTPREVEVLDISISTVKNHTHNIYSKLGVRNGLPSVAKARDVGILPPA